MRIYSGLTRTNSQLISCPCQLWQQQPVKDGGGVAAFRDQFGDAGRCMMARQRYVAAIDAYRQGPMDTAVSWNKLGIANHHMLT